MKRIVALLSLLAISSTAESSEGVMLTYHQLHTECSLQSGVVERIRIAHDNGDTRSQAQQYVEMNTPWGMVNEGNYRRYLENVLDRFYGDPFDRPAYFRVNAIADDCFAHPEKYIRSSTMLLDIGS